MKTRAPGKVVLSGAYSVLEGAPAIVTAVDRYVVVDSERVGDYFPEEAKAAGFTAPYWYDASELRSDGKKLGLGSSAAILVSMLAARELLDSPPGSVSDLGSRVFEPALVAHRKAQGGGSGIDVAASCYGGSLVFQRGDTLPRLEPLTLPSGLTIEVWASDVEASTKDLIARVRSLRAQDPELYRTLLNRQADAAAEAVIACRENSPSLLVAALQAQRTALRELGQQAGAMIVTPEVEALALEASRLGAAVLPAGAGGGDIAIYVGLGPSDSMSDSILKWSHRRLRLRLGAPGVAELRDHD